MESSCWQPPSSVAWRTRLNAGDWGNAHLLHLPGPRVTTQLQIRPEIGQQLNWTNTGRQKCVWTVNSAVSDSPVLSLDLEHSRKVCSTSLLSVWYNKKWHSTNLIRKLQNTGLMCAAIHPIQLSHTFVKSGLFPMKFTILIPFYIKVI